MGLSRALIGPADLWPVRLLFLPGETVGLLATRSPKLRTAQRDAKRNREGEGPRLRLDRGMDATADSLITAFDYVWARLTGGLTGLTDEDYFWEPVAGC